MTDYLDTGSGDSSGTGDAGLLQAWVTGAQSRVAQGLPLDNSGQWDPTRGKFGTPLGYAVHDGQLVKDNNAWGAIWPGFVGMAGMGTLGALVGPTLGPVTGANAALDLTPPASLAAPATTGPLLGAETGIPATAAALAPPATLAAVSGPAAGAGTGLSLTKLLTSLAAPAAFAVRGLTGPGTGGGSGVSSLDPNLLAQLSKLIDLSTQRAQEGAPVHQAATALATRLTPQAQYSAPPSAINAAAQPLPTGPSMTPQVMAAFQKLMAGGK